MSLVLNGGVEGTGTTQYSYLDSSIASGLPIIISCWFKCGQNASAGGHLLRVCDASETVGNYSMGLGLSRSTGPQLTATQVVRTTAGTVTSYTTRTDLTDGRYAYPVTEIVAGSSTVITVDTLGDSMPYSVGMYVRLSGTITGLSGIVVDREYRVASISGSDVTLTVTSTGSLSEGWSATVKASAWQPELWNMMVVRLSDTADPARLQMWGGYFGAPGITITSAVSGSNNPSVVWAVADRICMGGSYQSSTGTGTFRGELAHLAVWQDVDLSETNAAELLTVAPNLVSWGTPLAYVPCIDDGTATVGATNLTTIGSPSFTSAGPSITTAGGGGTPGFNPTLMRARRALSFGLR